MTDDNGYIHCFTSSLVKGWLSELWLPWRLRCYRMFLLFGNCAKQQTFRFEDNSQFWKCIHKWCGSWNSYRHDCSYNFINIVFFIVLLTLFIWFCKVYDGWNSTGQVLYDGKVSSIQNSGQIGYSVNQKMMIKFTIVQFIPSPTLQVFNSKILHWNVATVKQI